MSVGFALVNAGSGLHMALRRPTPSLAAGLELGAVPTPHQRSSTAAWMALHNYWQPNPYVRELTDRWLSTALAVPIGLSLAGATSGSVIRIEVPLPGAETSVIRPPSCSVTRLWTM